MTGGLILGSSPANAVTCSNSTVKPTNSLTGTTVAATGFESAAFTPFVPSTATTGAATISTSQHRTGTCSAKLHVTNDSGSVALMSVPLGSTAVKTANADGWFNITTAGLTGNDVPYLRFFSETACGSQTSTATTATANCGFASHHPTAPSPTPS